MNPLIRELALLKKKPKQSERSWKFSKSIPTASAFVPSKHISKDLRQQPSLRRRVGYRASDMPRFTKFFTWKRSDCCRHCLDFTSLPVAIIILHFLGKISSVRQRPSKRLKKKEEFQKAFASLGDTSVRKYIDFFINYIFIRIGGYFLIWFKKSNCFINFKTIRGSNFFSICKIQKIWFFSFIDTCYI